METPENLIKWLKEMGYNGVIPESIKNICNSSTFFIWNQVINNCKRRQDVEFKRNNIIINRLKNKLENQDDFAFSMPEIDSYWKKTQLKKQIEILKNKIEEKQIQVDLMEKNNKIKYIKNQKLKNKIKESEEKEHILNSKCKLLQNNIVSVKNLVPTELGDNPEDIDLSVALYRSVSKLEQLISKNPPQDILLNECDEVSSTQQTTRDQLNSTFEERLSVTEHKLTDTKLKIFTRGVCHYDKENKKRNAQVNRQVLKNILLEYVPATPLSDNRNNVETNKNGVKNQPLGNIGNVLSPSNRQPLGNCNKTSPNPNNGLSGNCNTSPLASSKNESLENCDVATPLSSVKRKPLCNRNVLSLTSNNENKKSTTEKIATPLSSEKKVVHNRNCNRESLGILHNFNVSDDFMLTEDLDIPVFTSPQYPSLLTETSLKAQILQTCLQLSQNVTTDIDFYDKKFSYENILNNDKVTELIKEMLQRYNRKSILNCFQDKNEFVVGTLKDLLMVSDKNTTVLEINEFDMHKLSLINVYILRRNTKHVLKHDYLLRKIEEEKENIKKRMMLQRLSVDRMEEIKYVLELEVENLSVNTITDCMREELSSAPRYDEKPEFGDTMRSVSMIRMQNEKLVHEIQCLMSYIQKTLKLTKKTREETISCVERLNTFTLDTSWAECLLKKLNSNEVQTFKKFPLEFNRKCRHIQGGSHFRDLCTMNLPANVSTPENLQMITRVLETPYYTPEKIILNIVRSKMKLESIKSLKKSDNINYNKYDLEDLNSKEQYIQKALDNFNSLMNSSSSIRTLSSASTMKKMIDLWMQVPLRNFISNSRLVDGHDYQFYEDKFEQYLG